MRNLLASAALCATLGVTTPAVAAACLDAHLPRAEKVGSGEGRRLFFHAYDATLAAPGGTYRAEAPFALTLVYRMQFSSRDIARETMAQMRRIGSASRDDIARWGRQLERLLPDVGPGTALTGIRLADGQTVFCTAKGEIGRIDDPAFADAFFEIWLGNASESPTLRRQLTGQS